jgi:hypothetical protein
MTSTGPFGPVFILKAELLLRAVLHRLATLNRLIMLVWKTGQT